MMQGRNDYVRGLGLHPFGKHPGKTLKRLAATAALGAPCDAGIDLRSIQAASCANPYVVGKA